MVVISARHHSKSQRHTAAYKPLLWLPTVPPAVHQTQSRWSKLHDRYSVALVQLLNLLQHQAIDQQP
jgi:hypothetical protein